MDEGGNSQVYQKVTETVEASERNKGNAHVDAGEIIYVYVPVSLDGCTSTFGQT